MSLAHEKSIAFLIALALSGCNDVQPEQEMQTQRPVLTETVALESRVEERQFVATIRPRFETDLSFRVSGKVANRAVDVGQTVKKGHVLATFNETNLKL